MNWKSNTYPVEVYVIKDQHASNNLLGRESACRMGLVQRLAEVNSEVYGDIGLLRCDPVKIELQGDTDPYCVNVARRIPFPLMSKVEEEFQRMQNAGIIERGDRTNRLVCTNGPSSKEEWEDQSMC